MNDHDLQRWQLYVRQRVLIDPNTGCWVWQLRGNKKGYGNASAAYDMGLDSLAHRLAYTMFIGPIPDGFMLRHQCHNPPCCNPAHLLVGTNQDNMDDNKRIGVRHTNAKLSVEQVAEIKRVLALKIYSQRHIAAMFSISQMTISLIARGKHWADIQPATKEGK